ncbi:syntaxin-17 [Copidosoma floridanum]|uniref:syntaxin-17 n=1 Tax=Copidosoma floridanum TaxID=29053 RepID=UPI0006C99E0B|nr:syntaxin-17 [Copidosoma floridanum]
MSPTVNGEGDNEVDVKQPIKRLEIPIAKFNDVAIPHHLDLLKRHRNNIKKCQSIRDWDRIYAEQLNATRTVKQLKQLLYEMDTLRAQVQDSDISVFDKLTIKSRTNTMNAIKEYLDFELNLPLIQHPPPKVEKQLAENPHDNHFHQIQVEQEELERQQACLNTWNTLHSDLEQLQQLFIDFNKVVHEQSELVSRIEDNVEDAQGNVQSGLKHLKDASKYKVMTYPLTGALLGTCLGGPIGFIAGLKVGGLAAIGGGLLGFTGGKILKQKCSTPTELKQIEPPPEASSSEKTPSREIDKKNS